MLRQFVEGGGIGGPAVDPFAERVGLAGWEARSLGHLPQRAARPVRDDVRHLRGTVAAVALVHVLDHFLAALVLDVEIDVGRAVALRRQEPFEQEAERDRICLGDTERVTHRAVRRAPPALAVDVAAAAELDDVVQQQEVAGEAQLFDHTQLVGRSVGALGRAGRASAGTRPQHRTGRARAATTSRYARRGPGSRVAPVPRA